MKKKEKEESETKQLKDYLTTWKGVYCIHLYMIRAITEYQINKIDKRVKTALNRLFKKKK